MPTAYASAVVPASADTVWEVIRDFNDLPVWHPGIAESRIEDDEPGDAVGCVRNFTLQDGARFRERLLMLSDVDRTVVYNFETTPLPVRNYRATLRVIPVTLSGQAFVEWFTTFDCAQADEAEMTETFAGGVFATGLTALQRRFA